MTPIETALLFVGSPAAITAVLAGLVFGAGARRLPRYRPGRPFAYAPVWFVAADRAAAHHADGGHAAIEARHDDGRDRTPAVTGSVTPQPKGGARGTW
ncbi:MAG TPA: hypothetical protein VGD72_15635 [Mycobacteriales bacterium]|jgi:hypothetical protein